MSFHFLGFVIDGYGIRLKKYENRPKRALKFKNFKRNGKKKYSAAEYRSMWAEGYHSAREYEKSKWW